MKKDMTAKTEERKQTELGYLTFEEFHAETKRRGQSRVDDLPPTADTADRLLAYLGYASLEDLKEELRTGKIKHKL